MQAQTAMDREQAASTPDNDAKKIKSKHKAPPVPASREGKKAKCKANNAKTAPKRKFLLLKKMFQRIQPLNLSLKTDIGSVNWQAFPLRCHQQLDKAFKD